MRLTALLLSASVALAANAQPHPVALTHLHGLSYSGDGRKLVVPERDGLAVYESGRWSKEVRPPRDYTGFLATAKAFYGSRDPAPHSGTVNALGLARSRDGGKTWEQLALRHASDFPLLAASWNTNAIYGWNAMPGSRAKQPRLHYTLNEGLTWKTAQALGLGGEPRALAAHPDEPGLLAVASSKGIFESADWGESFKQVAGAEGTAVFYDLDGSHLWYGIFDGRARLARARLRAGPIVWIDLPPLGADAVACVAQNPAFPAEYAIATYGRNVYLSRHAGRDWTLIRDRGAGR